jgi:hypothetical protein
LHNTIYGAADNGLLNGHRIRTRPNTRGTWRFTEEQVHRYVQATRTAGAAPVALKHIKLSL